MTDNSNSDDSDREQQGIEGNVALETWSQRVTTQIYGDGELKIHGPYYQHSKDDDPYIRLTLTADDCDHDGSGGTFSFSVGLASAGVLATVIHDACEREPEVLLGELSETDEDADGRPRDYYDENPDACDELPDLGENADTDDSGEGGDSA